MENAESLKKLAKKLCAARENANHRRCLRYLGRLIDMDPSANYLEGTPIIYQVQQLGASSNEEVSSLAKELLRKWPQNTAGVGSQPSIGARKRKHATSPEPEAGIAPRQSVPKTVPQPPRHSSSTSLGAVPKKPTRVPATHNATATSSTHANRSLQEAAKKPAASHAQTVTGASREAYMDPLLEAERAKAASRLRELRSRGYGSSDKKVTYNYKLKLDKFVALDSVAVDEDATAKRKHTVARTYRHAPRLIELCLRTMERNIDSISELKDIPVRLLDRLLYKCSPAQLARLEAANEYLVEDTDHYWERHCNKQAYTGPIPPRQGWRQLYKRQTKADNIRFQLVAQGLSQRYKELEDSKKQKQVTVIDPTNDWLRSKGIVRPARQRASVPSSSSRAGGLSKLQKLRHGMNKTRR